MREDFPIPSSISHKSLNKLMVNAKKELTISLEEGSSEFSHEREFFHEKLEEWSLISKELLSELSRKEEYLKDKRSTKSIMALGALEAHLNMAMQALKASKENQ
ncbi:possible MATH domain [Prochlorococcus marinus str. MIT 9211]|uniref:Possible MATH domain n=2 Tax=Prochlorococcus marinus TaxID=1219 RepID=A9BBY2_PROM4|nr:possible MATH domain [Prochlorococcus marinus str. MIT 9211]